MNVPDLVGLIGVAAYLSAYGLLQLGTLKVEDNRYALLNALGAVLILYSLLFDFNLASFVTQSAWLMLTAIGYIRSHIKRSRAVQP
ncbi:cyclic nucleotide-binding protein [Microvirga sp. VF16]|uniref:CBU_0592 family membrane protein n=1 Tax=Microvirga sp. VF16 TaxID=2807101 RepID=UPI00193DF697|nr:cyclic nucleotide-binding protein [Microvirga sp. VF16]QRM31036.1 cyclic nucleotide-binding protein [Microvirga sp. VF16]